jgi:hypothetical protein
MGEQFKDGTTTFVGNSPCWEANSSSASQKKKNSSHFMESECSSSCSQQHATSPYPNPHQYTPWHPAYFLTNYFDKILTFWPKSPKWPPSLRFQHQRPACTNPIPYIKVSHVPRNRLTFKSRRLKLYTTRFNIYKFYVLPHAVYLCVLRGSQNKQRFFTSLQQ